jgi:hypothetical protein
MVDKLHIVSEDAHNLANTVTNFGHDSQTRATSLTSRLDSQLFSSGWIGPAATVGADGQRTWNTNANVHIGQWNQDHGQSMRMGVETHEIMDQGNQMRNANIGSFAGGGIGTAINPTA